MIDIDNPPMCMLAIIIFVFTAPFLYSFIVDNWDKQSPKIHT